MFVWPYWDHYNDDLSDVCLCGNIWDHYNEDLSVVCLCGHIGTIIMMI